MLFRKPKVTVKHSVHKLIEKHFAEGFLYGVVDASIGKSHTLEYKYAPAWYNEVANIAQEAGYVHAREQIERAATLRLRLNPANMDIPAKVYMECYAAARLT